MYLFLLTMGQAQPSQFSKTVCFLAFLLEYKGTNKTQINDYKEAHFYSVDKIHIFY